MKKILIFTSLVLILIFKIFHDSNLLTYPNGKVENLVLDDTTLEMWNIITPLSNIKIPLSLFDNINLENIIEFNILFDNTKTGGLMFKSFTIN